jgi:hypothetical protein
MKELNRIGRYTDLDDHEVQDKAGEPSTANGGDDTAKTESTKAEPAAPSDSPGPKADTSEPEEQATTNATAEEGVADDNASLADAPTDGKPTVGVVVAVGPETTGGHTNGVAKVQNVALMTAVTGLDPSVIAIMQRATKLDYGGSPAERRKAIYGDLERLRSQSTLLRTRAEEKMFGDAPDKDEAKRIVDQAKEVDKAAVKLGKAYEDLLNRAQRRARRDDALKTLERDPATGKAHGKESFYYDPMRPEMEELYAHQTTPALVYADQSKLVRADSGKYGRTGGHVIVAREAARRAGEVLSDRLLYEIVKGMDWDLIERVHGMGSGLCRTGSWVMRLWSQTTKTPLEYDALPRRHPLPNYEQWVEEFDAEYAKAIDRVGSVPHSTAVDTGDVQEGG